MAQQEIKVPETISDDVLSINRRLSDFAQYHSLFNSKVAELYNVIAERDKTIKDLNQKLTQKTKKGGK